MQHTKLSEIAMALTEACRDLGVEATVGLDPRLNIYRMMPIPSGVLLPVSLGKSTKISSLLGIIEDLDRRLQICDTSLRLSITRRPLSVEIRRDGETTDAIEMSDTTISSYPLQPFQGIFGVAIRLEGSFIPIVDLGDPEMPHLLFLGASGTGKTTAMQNVVLSLASVTPPSECSLVLIDPKRRGLPPLGTLPHVVMEAYTPEEIVSVVRWLEKETNDRVQTPKTHRVIGIMDETSEILRIDPNLQASLISTAQRGRELGVHLFAADQRPMSGTLGGSFLQQFGGRLVGRLRTPRESADILGTSDPTLVHLHGRGSMVWFPGGRQQVKVQTFLPNIPSILSSIKKKWPSPSSRLDIRDEDVSPHPKYDVEADLSEMMPVFEKFYDPTNDTMRRGGYAAAARAIGSDYGGSTITRVALALSLWKDQPHVISN